MNATGKWLKGRTLGARMRRAAASEDGGATVEAVLWIPLFLALLAVIADASLLFHRQAQMLRAVQDANRAFSTGQLDSTGAVQEVLLGAFANVSENAEAFSFLDTSIVPGGIIRTQLSIPARDVNTIGLIAGLADFQLTVTSQHYREF
jgi:Flp pilus assembly protein TadG